MSAQIRKAATIAIAVAAILGAAIGAGPARREYHRVSLERELVRLVDVAAKQSAVTSRLSISSPPRHAKVRSGGGDSKPLELYAAAMTVLEGAKDVDSRTSTRASAIAHYYAGDYGRAAHALENVVREAFEAAAWNDLAAARIEASKARGDALEILAALVAIDQALALDPIYPAALYNRAAILDVMGLRRQARDAWRLALVAESNPGWRDDIRKHLEQMSADVDATLGPKAIAGVQTNNPDDAHEVVNRFPQDARRYAEGVLPVAWAASLMNGDRATAEEKLRLARALATALRDRSGETLGTESIDTIDSAMKNHDGVAALTRAYSVYGEGRALLGRYEFAAAENKLVEAAKLFERAKSPMADVARYFSATAILEQNRVDEAAAKYAELVIAQRATRGHRGLAADIAWQVARTEGMRGHWDAALDAAQEAVNGFRALGEKQSTGFMENMLAELYEYLAQPERAWTHRLVAFSLLSGYANQVQVSLGAAARERIRRKDWPAAIALLDIEIAGSKRTDQASLLVDALACRARARVSNGDAIGARKDVVAARAAVEGVRDLQERARVVAEIDVAEGIVEREHDLMNSVRLFTRAINFYQQTSRPILLPEIHLERGRLHLALGSELESLADFNRGIDRLEEQRATLSDFDLRSTASDVGEDLYNEAIRIAARTGDVERAYRFSERSRGRALVSRLAAADVPAPMHVQQGTRVVEFAVLPEKVIVFTLDHALQMKELVIGRAKLEHLVDTFRERIIDNAPQNQVRMSSAALYDALLRPVGDVTAGVSTLVVVPSGILERVPWAALYDREKERYLVEDIGIVTAPSATVYTLIGGIEAARSPRALIVGNPEIALNSIDLPALRGAEKEAQTIATLYRTCTVLLGADATVRRFEHEVKTCDVLHFAGHAVSSEIADDQSFLVLAPGEMPGDSGMLYSRDIAKLDMRGVSLVVLAACGTIRGPTVHVDGMPSIGRAFIAAGAKAVIGTLWDVDDDRSAALFATIHRNVSVGMAVSDAIRNAQIKAIRSTDPATSHPKAWGYLTLIGGR